MLTLTGNSTSFQPIRQALRSLFDEGMAESHSRRPRHTWWTETSDFEAFTNDSWGDGWYDDATYYQGEADPYVNSEPYYPTEPEVYHDDATYYQNDPNYYGEPDYAAEPETYYEGEAYDEEGDHPEEAELVHDEKEAYAIAQEAKRTLQQARAAVAKARAARGYFPLGGKDGGKGKDKNKGGPKGKNLGPCYVCGQPGHRFYECPRRFGGSSSPGGKDFGKKAGKRKGGRPPSQKGKSGKGSFFHEAYTLDLETEALDPEEKTLVAPESVTEDPDATILVLSVGDLAVVGPTQVIVDTGATESACGIRSMDKLLRALQCPFEVSLAERPSFRFGDGRSLKAVSKVTFATNALGPLSFFLLDDTSSHEAPRAQDTPLLLGGRTLRSLKAILSYEDNMMTFEKADGTGLAVLALYPTKNGHLAVDLSESSTPLGVFQSFVLEEFGLNIAMPGDEAHSLDVFKTPGLFNAIAGGSYRPTSADDSVPPGPSQPLKMYTESVFGAIGADALCDVLSDPVPASSPTGLHEMFVASAVPPVCAKPLFHEHGEGNGGIMQLLRLKFERGSQPDGPEDDRPFLGRRPSSSRMALRGDSCGRQSTRQPVRKLELMREMRAKAVLPAPAGFKVKFRQAGPPRSVLLRALGELRMEYTAENITATIINGRCVEIVGRRRQEGYNLPLTEKMPKEKAKPQPTTNVEIPPGSASKAGLKARVSPSKAAPPKATSVPAEVAASSSTPPVHQDDEQLAAGLSEIEALKKRLAAQKGAILEEMALRYNADGDEEMAEWLRTEQEKEEETE